MRHVLSQRRADGLVELRPFDSRVTRAEWYFAAFTIFMLAAGMFLATAMPPAVLGMLFFAIVLGEVCFGLRDLLLLRNPRAEVRVLARPR